MGPLMASRWAFQLLGLGLTTIGLALSSFAGTSPWGPGGLPAGVTAPAQPAPNLLGTTVSAPVCPYQSANIESGAQNNFALVAQLLSGVMSREWEQRDKEGDKYDEEWTEVVQKNLGTHVNAQFGRGCQNFFDKDGKVMPWGRTAIAEIRKYSSTFIDKTPRDVAKYCPKYGSFDTGQKERFWTWNLMSMASAESDCNPKDESFSQSGHAKGLFQMDEGVCNNYELSNPHGSITCAVRRLAKEIDNRGTLMSTCSSRCANPREATNWGVLRIDDENKARGGDIKGAQKMRSLLSKFQDCGN